MMSAETTIGESYTSDLLFDFLCEGEKHQTLNINKLNLKIVWETTELNILI